MKQRIMVDIGNLMLTISDAIDLASPSLAQHQQRVGYIVWELAKAAQFPADMTERLFLAALLHDVGAFSVEEKLALSVFEEKNCEPHCIRGEILFRQVPWLLNSAEIIRHHHRTWEEWHESIDQPPVLASQMLYTADNLERLIDRDQYILHQNNKLLSRIKEGAGDRYHPQVLELLMSISRREEFWLDLVSPRLYSLLLHTIAGFERIAEWAAFHHERLDGSGYPFRCHSAELDTGARLLMVADLFTALAEDRPYRKGMPKEKIINILEDFGGRGLLDEQIIMLALDNYSELYERVNEEQAEAKKFYENQFAG